MSPAAWLRSFRSLLRSIGARHNVPGAHWLPELQNRFPDVLQCRIAYNTYGGYCLPLACLHRPAARVILSGGVHEPETLEFLRSQCGTGDVVHAGTFFGPLLPALSRSLAGDATLWAFEPAWESYRCALMTVSLNGLTNVLLTHAALGAQPEARILQVKDDHGRALGGASRILPEGTPAVPGTTESISVVRLDDVVPGDRHVSLIHLDVEGHEVQALEGARETIRRCRPVLVLETLPGKDWLAANLSNLDYRIRHQVHANTVLACKQT